MKKLLILKSDEEAERFVENSDLSEYDLSEFKPVSFKLGSNAAQLNMEMPKLLLEAVKDRAKARGISYTRYIRELLERDVNRQ